MYWPGTTRPFFGEGVVKQGTGVMPGSESGSTCSGPKQVLIRQISIAADPNVRILLGTKVGIREAFGWLRKGKGPPRVAGMVPLGKHRFATADRHGKGGRSLASGSFYENFASFDGIGESSCHS